LRHREETDHELHAADGAEVQRQQIEVDGAIGFGRDRQQLAARLGSHALMDLLEVRRLAAAARAVIHNLGDQLARFVIVSRHAVA
jgi:hypothetical protein